MSLVRPVLQHSGPLGHTLVLDIRGICEDEPALSELHPDEVLLARSMPPLRRPSFLGGRLAIRRAFGSLGHILAPPIGIDDRGAPVLPPGVRGSISHKGDYAGATVRTDTVGHVGFDLELERPLRIDIRRKVLTPKELQEDDVEGDRDSRMLRRFALKEALYKALDPTERRYIGFQEVEVALGQSVCEVRLLLRQARAPYRVRCDLSLTGPLIVATAFAERIGF